MAKRMTWPVTSRWTRIKHDIDVYVDQLGDAGRAYASA